MKLNKNNIVFGLILLGGASAGHWAYTRPQPKNLHVVDVFDKSGSMSDVSCKAVIIELQKKLERHGPALGQDSSYSLIITATGLNSPRARLVFDDYIPVVSSSAIAGKAGSKERDEFLSNIEKTCNRQGEARVSAIYHGVSLGLGHLESKGCGSKDTECHLYVLSDGDETGDKTTYRFLNGLGTETPPVLPNRIARTTFCNIDPDMASKWQQMFEAPIKQKAFCEPKKESPEVSVK